MPQCRAKAKRSGKQCARPAMLGGFVCQKHGGMAPQVKRKAAERLLLDQAVVEFGLDRARDPERLLAELGCIAYVKVSDLYDVNGRMLTIPEIKASVPQADAAIAQHEAVSGNVDEADGKRDRLIKVRFHDKAKMLELLAKHHGLLEERSKIDAEVVFRWKGIGE
jgi:hypothetical protein